MKAFDDRWGGFGYTIPFGLGGMRFDGWWWARRKKVGVTNKE